MFVPHVSRIGTVIHKWCGIFPGVTLVVEIARAGVDIGGFVPDRELLRFLLVGAPGASSPIKLGFESSQAQGAFVPSDRLCRWGGSDRAVRERTPKQQGVEWQNELLGHSPFVVSGVGLEPCEELLDHLASSSTRVFCRLGYRLVPGTCTCYSTPGTCTCYSTRIAREKIPLHTVSE